MRDNWNLSVSHLVQLVPYQRKFVENYHRWMSDPALLEQTASEPLSLEEEYEMQKSWKEDPTKCTFIILHRGDSSEQERMIGDVNIFLHDREYQFNAEIDIMIAEVEFRGKGYARDAVLLMMLFGVRQLGITRYFAKINKSNEKSLLLFKSIGFTECNFVEAFQEFELEYTCGDENVNKIESLTEGCMFESYIPEE